MQHLELITGSSVPPNVTHRGPVVAPFLGAGLLLQKESPSRAIQDLCGLGQVAYFSESIPPPVTCSLIHVIQCCED